MSKPYVPPLAVATARSITRREFVHAGALVGAAALVPAALGAMPAARPCASSQAQGLSPPVAPAREPVVSFFMDQPYLDLTGEAQPYLPPAGYVTPAELRAAQPSAQHMESLFHVC
jgi:hypothetical protein